MNIAGGRDLEPEKLKKSHAACGACKFLDCRFRQTGDPLASIKFHELERGDSLECDENACLHFWNIIEGYAATSTLFRDGRRQILCIESAGDTVCGAMAAPDSEQRLEALTECKICEVDLSPCANHLLGDPIFLAMMTRLMHGRLEKSMARAAVLGRLDSHERVTYYLAEMAFLQSDTKSLVTLPMSREDIADYLGLNTDSVSRVLSRLRKSGLFRFLSPTEYTVPDMKAVARRLPVSLPTAPDSVHFDGGKVT